MTRSKVRKLKRAGTVLASGTLAAALFGQMPAAYGQSAAQSSANSEGLEEIIVTAEKRTQNLQDVPASIQAIGNKELTELHIEDFTDYMLMIPSASIQELGPGNNRVFMRGIAAGDYPNHSASLPSVGTYLDDQPLTTILGAIDVHVYDIERVEALAGPQGTLYGASSESGTIRIITNKPDPTAFSAAYDVEGSVGRRNAAGGMAEGYANIPLSDIAAVRVVGWYQYSPGYIDNVRNTLTYPGYGADVPPDGLTGGGPFTINNAATAKNNYNDSETYGARAALKINLGDSWSITPMLMSQITESNGIFAEEIATPLLSSAETAPIGPNQVSHFLPESSYDDFSDAALTVDGKLGTWDVMYATSFMKRHNVSYSDYSDYSLAYDTGNYWYDTSGKSIQPTQYITGGYNYIGDSNELRFTSPAEDAVRFVGGLYQQRQQNHILQRYVINGTDGDGLSAGDGSVPDESVTGWTNTWWLTDQLRVNRDWAAYGELSWDLIPKHLTATVGERWFKYDNTLAGFYGFGENSAFGAYGGEQYCTVDVKFYGAPCQDLVQPASTGSGTTPKYNLTYKFDEDYLIYGTYSKGFRPGGVNRTSLIPGKVAPPYLADYLVNWELGVKTSWFNHTLRFNADVFRDYWNDFQYDFLGPNSVTIIANAPKARSQGVEAEIEWQPVKEWTFTVNLASTDARLTADYCGAVNANGTPVTKCPGPDDTNGPEAPAGTPLPVTPPFKGNLTARYTFPIGNLNGYAEGALVYQDGVWSDMRLVTYTSSDAEEPIRGVLGQQPGFTNIDLTAGIEEKTYSFEIFVKNLTNEQEQLYRYAECTPQTCGPYAVYAGLAPPRTIGIRFGEKF
ncbi:MAG: TonB-dependent receptor [Steroidobacteraceae bacterium]|jgi:outer membrane receptor protein involved in Fe transport